MQRYLHHPLEYYGTRRDELGSGTSGEVYLYVKDDGEEFAIKIMRGIDEAFLRDTSMSIYSHPNLLIPIDCGINDQNTETYIVYPLALDDLHAMKGQYRGLISPAFIKSLFYQLALGLAYLHSRGIIHGDLKPDNILLFDCDIDTKLVKIADFNISENLFCGKKKSTRTRWSLLFKPPESLMEIPYDVTADVWSLACVFCEVITGGPLFAGMSEKDVLHRQFRLLGTPTREQWPDITSKMSRSFPIYPSRVDTDLAFLDAYPGLKDLILGMLVFNPARRLNSFEIIRHPYFDDAILPNCVNYEPFQPPTCNQLLDDLNRYPTKMVNKQYTTDARIILHSWIGGMIDVLESSMFSLFLASKLTDIFLIDNGIPMGKMQIYAFACTYLVIQFHDPYSRDLDDAMPLLPRELGNVEDVQNCMAEVVAYFKFNLNISTCQTYADELYLLSDNKVAGFLMHMAYIGLPINKLTDAEIVNSVVSIMNEKPDINVPSVLDAIRTVYRSDGYDIPTKYRKQIDAIIHD